MSEAAVPGLDLREVWERGMSFAQFVETVAKEPYQSLWGGIYRNAKAPAWAATSVPAGTTLRLVMLVEDWCLDTSNTAPFLARFAEAVPGVEFRVLGRDANPDVMDRYLTNGARAIPVVIALDGEFREIGHWGPRPSELQAWVKANKDTMPKEDRLRETRKWYARDRGETTIREVLVAAGVAKAV